MYIKINCADNRNYNSYKINNFKAKSVSTLDQELLMANRSFYDSFRKTSKDSIFYKDYDAFVKQVKRYFRHVKYIKLIPESLYINIFEKYGKEEKSIQKILQDSGLDVDKMPDTFAVQYFKESLKEIENTENEFAGIKDANQSEKLSVVYTNAWTRSRLRSDFALSCTKGSQWNFVKSVWLKNIDPNNAAIKMFSTPNLIDAYLVNSFKQGKRNFNGENPLAYLDNDKEMNRQKMMQFRLMYQNAMKLKYESMTLINPDYLSFKNTVDTESLGESIENLEEHYRNAFLKFFWNDFRKKRFSEALKKEYEKFNEKLELSNEIYEAIMEMVVNEPSV